MRSKPSDAQSNGSKVRSMVLCTSLHNTNLKSERERERYVGGGGGGLHEFKRDITGPNKGP
ncbi:hypothetical protein RHMOL_Rhmol07G0113800 [Rhododendron molle]|nr:hypothetical protein RHMOL_Rhmol07G0113800 [Rhododendron molle]